MTSLFIYIPFCRKKCFYCSFAVAIGQEQRIDHYLDCLDQEAAQYEGMQINTIYFGGGTPSHISEQQLKRLFEIIKSHFLFSSDVEFSCEANPEDINREKVSLLLQCGVNRMSLGVQSLNDDYLKVLGRIHHAQSAQEAFVTLRHAGFKNINLDLMFSFPDQTTQEIEKDLNGILSLNSDHLSLYTLTVEKFSRFFVQNIAPQDQHKQAEQYECVRNLILNSGFNQYEVSNFAKPGFESQHNINYWRGGNYIGLGMSAHSHCDGVRWWNVSRLNQYIERMDQQQDPKEDEETLSAQSRMMERILFGLRMNEGVNIKEVEDQYLTCITAEKKKEINELVEGGLLAQQGQIIQATDQGRLVLDAISSRLI